MHGAVCDSTVSASAQGLEQWEASAKPFTSPVALGTAPWGLAPPQQAQHGYGLPAAAPWGLAPQHAHQEYGFPAAASCGGDAGAQELLACLAGAKRGLLVVGQLATPQDCVAALRVAQALGWPVVADVLSGAIPPLLIQSCLC